MLDAELAADGRPSHELFESQLGQAVELTLSALWDDPSYVHVADAESGIRTVLTAPVPPYMFPPGVFYARLAEEDVVELIGLEFDWDYDWDQA
ncbi:MAG: hypothetical protein WB239_02430 [Acidimicrobiia bacterium]